jgi:hypothetical protein
MAKCIFHTMVCVRGFISAVHSNFRLIQAGPESQSFSEM